MATMRRKPRPPATTWRGTRWHSAPPADAMRIEEALSEMGSHSA